MAAPGQAERGTPLPREVVEPGADRPGCDRTGARGRHVGATGRGPRQGTRRAGQAAGQLRRPLRVCLHRDGVPGLPGGGGVVPAGAGTAGFSGAARGAREAAGSVKTRWGHGETENQTSLAAGACGNDVRLRAGHREDHPGARGHQHGGHGFTGPRHDTHGPAGDALVAAVSWRNGAAADRSAARARASRLLAQGRPGGISGIQGRHLSHLDDASGRHRPAPVDRRARRRPRAAVFARWIEDRLRLRPRLPGQLRHLGGGDFERQADAPDLRGGGRVRACVVAGRPRDRVRQRHRSPRHDDPGGGRIGRGPHARNGACGSASEFTVVGARWKTDRLHAVSREP